MSLTPALRSRIESLLQANRIVLFMKGEPTMPQCGFSAKASGILTDLGVDYTAINVLTDQALREGIKIFGDWPTIPQVYVDATLIGGSDILQQMYENGELSRLLGVSAPDRTPPTITITPAAAIQLQNALKQSPNAALALSIDSQFQTDLQLVAINPNALSAESSGIRLQMDLASARRANGMRIDWVDDFSGRGLKITNPNAPGAIQDLSPQEAQERVRSGKVTLVDVRNPQERAQATVALPFQTLDDSDERAQLERLPKETPIAFLCHFGRRSTRVAEHFMSLGFTQVFNITGGIDAWSVQLDHSIPRYPSAEQPSQRTDTTAH